MLLWCARLQGSIMSTGLDEFQSLGLEGSKAHLQLLLATQTATYPDAWAQLTWTYVAATALQPIHLRHVPWRLAPFSPGWPWPARSLLEQRVLPLQALGCSKAEACSEIQHCIRSAKSFQASTKLAQSSKCCFPPNPFSVQCLR